MHGNKPLISVIMPAYNHERYVQEAIRSVMDQSYPNIELIIMDDGSKDSTFQKIKEMEAKCQKRFVRFIYQTQENQGICVTLNRLIALSKGQYIALIASDDKYTPNALFDLLSVLENNPDVGLVVGKNWIMDSNSKQCYWDENRNNVYQKSKAKWTSFSDFIFEKSKIDFTSNVFGTYKQLLKSNHIPNGYLIKKNILDQIGPYTKEAPLEDHWLMLQISKYAPMKYIDVPCFYYRWHSNNTIKQTEKMRLLEKKTFFWEEKLVQERYPNLLPVFYEAVQKRKNLINLSPVIKLYKVKDLHTKQLKLVLFGISFTLYKKKNTK